MANKLIKGNDILYHFFQKCLEDKDTEFSQKFIKLAIDTLGIWLHPEYFHHLPVIVPYACRDSKCRKNPLTGADEWGMPDENGYFRDDNSLVKCITKPMSIISKFPWYSGKFGNDFVACHVWREPTDYAITKKLASRIPELNTFIPNLVWLPSQIAKLTDREGSFAQHYLQALSRHVYSKIVFHSNLQIFVDKLWAKLPQPTDLGTIDFPDHVPLFEYKENLIQNRYKKIDSVIAFLDNVKNGISNNKNLISKRYTVGLPLVAESKRDALRSSLFAYRSLLGSINQ